MTDILVTSPFQPFTLPTQFKAVFNGYIYCGTVDAVDPSVSQVQVYLVNEAGDKVPVAQPIRTNAAGFLVYNGQPAKFVTDSNHSLLVRDSLGNQVWYEPNMAIVDPQTSIDYILGRLPSPPEDLLFKGSALDPGTVSPGTSTTRGFEHAYYPVKAGALRVGGSDLLPLNDERNFWRGLPSQNAWGDMANIGLYSVALNRNGASYGTYSTTFGHDCVAYGTASIAGGAGSCTGNPDMLSDIFNGYCSFSFGKNNMASGQKSVAIGEEGVAATRASSTLGYTCTSQPSTATPDPVGSFAIGNNVSVTGQGGAIGKDISVADGYAFGSGANPGSKLLVAAGEVGIGCNTTFPAVRHKGDGSGRGKVGINNYRSLEHELDIDVGNGSTVGITIDNSGSATLSLRGLKGDGTSHSIADIIWTNPSLGSAGGEIAIRMNGRTANAFAISSSGSVQMQEIKTASTISGSPAGTIYNDGGTLKIV